MPDARFPIKLLWRTSGGAVSEPRACRTHAPRNPESRVHAQSDHRGGVARDERKSAVVRRRSSGSSAPAGGIAPLPAAQGGVGISQCRAGRVLVCTAEPRQQRAVHLPRRPSNAQAQRQRACGAGAAHSGCARARARDPDHVCHGPTTGPRLEGCQRAGSDRRPVTVQGGRRWWLRCSAVRFGAQTHPCLWPREPFGNLRASGAQPFRR